MHLPSDEEIKALHQKYAPNEQLFDTVFTHCQIVAEIAQQLIDHTHTAVDEKLVHAGCLLHDIGVYKLASDTKTDYLKHGLLGYELLKAEGFDEALCRIAARHTGVGLTKEDIIAQHLPLPHRDLVPETAEERLVAYADKFHSKFRRTFNAFESYRTRVSAFGEDKAATFDKLAVEFGKPDLESFAEKYNQPIQ